jgi:hypothetical protein
MGTSLNLSPIASSLTTTVCSTFALLREFVIPEVRVVTTIQTLGLYQPRGVLTCCRNEVASRHQNHAPRPRRVVSLDVV